MKANLEKTAKTDLRRIAPLALLGVQGARKTINGLAVAALRTEKGNGKEYEKSVLSFLCSPRDSNPHAKSTGS